MRTTSEATNAFLIHLSALLGFLFPFAGVIIPLVLWKAQKKESDFIDATGKEVVNFNISFSLYRIFIVISFIANFFISFFKPNFAIIIISIFIYSLFEIINICLIILAATKAKKGEVYQYPLTMTFLK